MVDRRRPLAFVGASLALALGIACTTFSAAEATDPPGADAGESGAITPGDAEVDGAVTPLEGGIPEGSIAVDEFLIDAYEATNAEYEAFVASFNMKQVLKTRRAACAAKLAPGRGVGCSHDLRPDAPATCVDWCDADLYCAHRGQRLCGERGAASGILATLTDRSHSQWTRACAGADGTQRYPYGPLGDPAKCNTLERKPDGGATVVPVGSLPSCVGSAPGLYDMSGNVLEWEDACDGDQAGIGVAGARCYARGGSYLNPIASANCDYVSKELVRSDARPNVGFRCCSLR